MRNPKKIYSKIYQKNINQIFRFIFLKVNSQEIAEDLCSETFLRGWQVFKKNYKEIENPRAFLYQIARNLIIDHYREKNKAQLVSVDSFPLNDARTSLEEDFVLSFELERVKNALNNIPDNYQEVIILHYIDDLKISEIAEITQKSEGAVRVMLHRALKALKEELEKEKKEGFKES